MRLTLPVDVIRVEVGTALTAHIVAAAEADIAFGFQCCKVKSADLGGNGSLLVPALVVAVDKDGVVGEGVVVADDIGQVSHRFTTETTGEAEAGCGCGVVCYVTFDGPSEGISLLCFVVEKFF